MVTLCRKLKSFKRPLKELNKLHFSHISERVAHAENDLTTHQSLLHQNLDNDQLLLQERHLRSSLLNLKQADLLYFRQKLKCNFLKEAYKGSHFFHALMGQKHRRNHIQALKTPSGAMTSLGAEVGQEFVRFFSDLLGSTKQIVPINVNVIHYGPCLESFSYDIFLALVTNELIHQTLFSIDNDKALGPDGFSSLFLKRAWGIVGGDLCACH
jgi:hypothetical protein